MTSRKPSLPSASELQNLVKAYLEKKGVTNNELVGKNAILEPPFRSWVSESSEGQFEVILEGTGNRATFRAICSDVVVSQYRPDIVFAEFASDAKPILRRLTPLQKARRLLLDAVHPNSRLVSDEFYRRTRLKGGERAQVNARRRWGELRTEYGFDTTFEDGFFVRGSEFPVREPNPRPNMQKLNKDIFPLKYESHHGVCNKCKIALGNDEQSEDYIRPLLDHRRPVPVGGDDTLDNLQLFCVTCNNLKATACVKCPNHYECESCSWAYPETFHDQIVIQLSPTHTTQLKHLAEGSGLEPATFAKNLLIAELERFSE